MFKKFIIVLSLLILLIACKKKGELIIDETPEPENVISYDTVDFTEKPLISITKDDIVYILVRSDGYPGMYQGEDGKVHGIYVDLERMVMEKMGQKYQFKVYDDVASAAMELKTGVSHIALAVPDISDYRDFLNLSDPYETLNYTTFVKDPNLFEKNSHGYSPVRSYYGKKIGVQVTGFMYQSLRGHKNIELVQFPTTTKAMEALNNGFVDAVPENRETGSYYINRNDWGLKDVGINGFKLKISTGVSKIYDKSLINRYNSALNELLDDGSIDMLHKRYYEDKANEYKVWEYE